MIGRRGLRGAFRSALSAFGHALERSIPAPARPDHRRPRSRPLLFLSFEAEGESKVPPEPAYPQ
eukprot:9051174-Pyramimonas_sp.AAC.1